MFALLELLIVFILFFVMAFGIGFILNMLLKTTWMPIYALIIVLVVTVVWIEATQSTGNLWANLAEYTFVDYLIGLGGVAGAYLSGVTIKYLRVKGYQMF